MSSQSNTIFNLRNEPSRIFIIQKYTKSIHFFPSSLYHNVLILQLLHLVLFHHPPIFLNPIKPSLYILPHNLPKQSSKIAQLDQIKINIFINSNLKIILPIIITSNITL